MFFSKTKMSLENSPNSKLKDFFISKLKSWVWRILQTQGLSLENSPNSSSKSPNSFFSAKQWIETNPKLRGWVWRILQTQIQKKDFSAFGEISKLKGWVWRILQIPVQNLQTHSFLKNPNSEVEFGVFSKVNGWEFSKLRLFSKTPTTLNPKLYGQRPAAWN